MAYKSFKEYIESNYSNLLRDEIEGFVQENHDGQGFHSLNVVSLLKQQIENLQVMSLSCRIDIEPTIAIDVHVKADIVSKGLGISDYDADRKTRWFTVCLKAILRDGLHGIETISVDEYYGGKFDKENALDAYLVPYISSDQLEDIADDFTQFFYEDATYTGWGSPLKKILSEMELTWYLADLPAGEMGRMYFREKEEDYEVWSRIPERMVPKIEKVHDVITPGTMLISKEHYFINGYGSRADTISHEVVHWDKHKLFFEILSLLNGDEKSLCCGAEPVGSPDGLEGIAKARWWAEWQANALAPRYLMPRWIFEPEFLQRVEKYAHDEYLSRGEQLEYAMREVAEVFEVSPFEVKLRALQLGYKQVEGTFLRVRGHEQPAFSFNPESLNDYETFILDSKNGSRLYKEDPHFAELIDSEKFVYTGCVICRNAPLYVKKTDDPSYPQGYALTDYALEHVDFCCLKFKRHYTRDDQAFEYYDACYLCKDVNVAEFKEARDIDYSVNEDVLAEKEGLKGYEEEGERLAKILEALPPTFWGTLDAHMNRIKNGKKKLTNEEMQFRTGLSEKYIRELRKGYQNVSPSTVYALCIGLHLHPYLSDDFIRKGRADFPLTKEGMYCRTLIERHYMEPLSYVNEKLKERGYKPWGDENKIMDVGVDAL